MIEVALEKDFEDIYSMYREVIDAVNKTEIRLGWNIDCYPDANFIRDGIAKRQMLVMRNVMGQIIATAVVNHTVNKEYEDIVWKIARPSDKIATIHALAVHPNHRGKSISDTFLNAIEVYCKELGDVAIHLDVIDTNVPAYKLYLRNGYEEMACIKMYYEVVGTREFWMLEKIL